MADSSAMADAVDAGALDAALAGRLRDFLASGRAGAAWVTYAPGSGMSRLVRALVEDLRLEPVWVTAAAAKSREFLRTVCRSPVAVTFKRKVLVMDELDVLLSNDAAMLDVAYVVKHSAHVPVVCLLKHTRAARECDLRKKAALALDFPAPPPHALAAVAVAVARAEGLDEARARALCDAAPPGDLRHVLTTLRAGACATARDYVAQTAESVARVFGSCATLDEALRIYGGDAGAVAGGVFETYCDACDTIEQAAGYADSASAGDLIDEHIHARQRWDLAEAHGACAVASAALCLPRRRVALERYGVAWNKNYMRLTKAKQLRAVDRARRERGLAPLGADGAAYVRHMLLAALAAKGPRDATREAFVALAAGAGLDAANVLNVMRLWDSGYTLSTHARVRRWLAA